MSRKLAGFLLLATLPLCGTVRADEGGVVGWVEDAKGAPVAGALVSLFGKGLRSGGLLTETDSLGRFSLPSLPAGSYTLRAIGGDNAASRRITVLPNRDSIFTLSFAALAQNADPETALEAGSQNERELRWLLRHKRRSVLEAQGPQTTVAQASAPSSGRLLENLVPWIPQMSGSVQVMTSPSLLGVSTDDPTLDLQAPSLSALRLEGRLAGSGHWSLGGLLADAQDTTWRMAAEFVLDPGAGQKVRAGAGYGTWLLQPGLAAATSASQGRYDSRTVGAVFAQDTWTINDRLQASIGGRYTYIGFLADRNHLSPDGSIEYRPDAHTRLRGGVSSRTLTPGGDLLTLSTLSAAPAMTLALLGSDVRPERLVRYEVAMDRSLGGATVGAFAFREGVRDRLLNVLERSQDLRSLRILNSQGVVVEAVGVSFGRRFGDCVRGSVSYSYGRSRPGVPFGDLRPVVLARPGGFHDLVAQVETLLDWSGTRLVAYYRFNTWGPEGEERRTVSTRFDVQLTQDLPFLKSVTRTDWEILLAFRNLFYETSEGSALDEIAVVTPPKRVLGGISVRF